MASKDFWLAISATRIWFYWKPPRGTFAGQALFSLLLLHKIPDSRNLGARVHVLQSMVAGNSPIVGGCACFSSSEARNVCSNVQVVRNVSSIVQPRPPCSLFPIVFDNRRQRQSDFRVRESAFGNHLWDKFLRGTSVFLLVSASGGCSVGWMSRRWFCLRDIENL